MRVKHSATTVARARARYACRGHANRAGARDASRRSRGAAEGAAGRMARGRRKGGGGRERREGEGKNSPPGIQTPAITSPNPRAPRGEREVEEGEGGYCAGENQMRQRD
jgi:hypothetical protein